MRYLTKYLSSPLIFLSRIVGYDGHEVRYYYQLHKTKLKMDETMDAQVFIWEAGSEQFS
ncbi:transposase [Candidatus Enterovibrio escicola]|uniref:transposase n=1 Tax=Candidatus Enterovibrio escicola TaxID=1927127 RepID=UPI001237A0F7